MWFDIIKVRIDLQSAREAPFSKEENLAKLKELENMFNSNEQKAIGYMPIAWSDGIVDEIKETASRLGLEYKLYEQKHPPTRADGNSFNNGGHFMWDASKIEPHIEEIGVPTVQRLIDAIAHTSYRGTPHRRIIDGLFGTPDIVLAIDRKERGE